MVMIFVGLRYGGAEQRDRNNNHPNPSDKNGAMEISFGYTSDGYRNKRVCNQEVPPSFMTSQQEATGEHENIDKTREQQGGSKQQQE